jgi:hypothetical protein
MRALVAVLPVAVTFAMIARPAHAQSAPGMIEVELERPGTVLQATEAWTGWHTYWTSRAEVCAAPCRAEVPRELKYRVVGDGFPPSAVFSLPGRDRVLLSVTPGDTRVHDGGGLLTLVGAIAASAGAVTAMTSSGDKGSMIGGLVCLGVGGVALAIGIPMLLTSATTVRFE